MINKHLKAMIADDEDHIRQALSIVVTSLEFGITIESNNGKEAVQLFLKEKPDLVLLDVNMPLMDGEGVLKQIKNDSEDSCIIMLTAVSDKETVERCLKLGANHFLIKNQPLPQLTEIIKETWLKFKEQRKQKKLNQIGRINFDTQSIEMFDN